MKGQMAERMLQWKNIASILFFVAACNRCWDHQMLHYIAKYIFA